MSIRKIYIFRPKVEKKKDFEKGSFRLLQKSDKFSICTELGQYISRVNRAYKKKVQKVQLVDLRKSDSSKPGRVSDWVIKSKEEDIENCRKKYPK